VSDNGPMQPTEDGEAIAFVQGFEARWPHYAPFLIHIPNEGMVRSANGSHIGKVLKRRRMGVKAGTSDYFLAYPTSQHCGLWLELKRPGGTVRHDQLDFLRHMGKQGYMIAVAWGAIAAMAAVQACIEHRREPDPFGMPACFLPDGRMYRFSEVTLTGSVRQRHG